MAFYGESYALTNVVNISGASASYAALVRHFDDKTVTAGVGDSFLANVFPTPGDSAALGEATDAVVSWVLEVGAGSSGTVSLASGLDPTSAGTDPARATEPLGTFTATGAGTIVARASITAADILNRFTVRPVLLVECDSGTVEILQVKLRVWPATGAGGAWVTGPSWRTPRDVFAWNSEPNNRESPQVDGVEAAWELGRALIDDLNGSSVGFLDATSASMSQRFDLGRSTSIPPFQDFAQTQMRVSIISPDLSAEGSTGPGIVGGVDPREIEEEGRVRAIGGGPLIPLFDGWDPGSTVHIDGDGQIGMAAIAEPVFTPHPTLSGWLLGTMTIPAPDGTYRTGGDTVPLLDSPHLALAVFAPNYFAPVDTLSGVTGGVTVSFTAVVPDYEWYDPAAIPAPELAPRFYVKHRDDTMRPVGFGKPATELTVFRVPGRGRWRDLTTDEYVTFGPDNRPPGGMPLKVKRLDASGAVWWDHVGWMVPDA